MRKENSTFKTKFISEAGSGLKNTDYFAFVELDNYACYCIADGIDKDKEKESAKLAVEEAIRRFMEKPSIKKSCINRCLKAANEVLKLESRELRLEASFLMVVTNYNTMRWGSAGNTRLYHVRNGSIKNKSADLSLSNNLADQGRLPQDKIEEHEERHNLYCYLGMPEKFQPVLSDKIKLEDGDSICLCTKGIWENAGAPELLDALEEAKEPEEVCDSVEELILARQKNNLPSYTICTIFADKVYKDPGKRKKLLKKLLIAAIPLLIIALTLSITFYILHKKNQEKINTMLTLKETGIQYIEEQNYKRALEKFKEGLEAVKKVKLKEKSEAYLEKEEIEQYQKLSELMVDAQEAMDKKDYKQAIHFYELALVQVKEILDYGAEEKQYIREQKELAAAYLEILSYIQSGDKMASIDNYAEAIEAYESALSLARDIFYTEGKDEASTKLDEVKTEQHQQELEDYIEEADEYADRAEDEEAGGYYTMAKKYYKEAANLYKKGKDKEKAKEMKTRIEELDEEESTSAKDQLAANADANITKGDQAVEDGNYDKALSYYQAAIDNYTAAEKPDSIPAVQVKMELAQSKNTATAKQEAQAAQYIEEAAKKESLKDYAAAAVLYGLARDIYREAGMSSDVNYMTKLILEMEKKAASEAENQAVENTSSTESTKTSTGTGTSGTTTKEDSTQNDTKVETETEKESTEEETTGKELTK
jgi:serine/threonine protein phosphatase PrpC